jgi:hypothetical protein
VSIFGVTGAAISSSSFAEVVPSGMHREKTVAQMTVHTEAVTGAGTACANPVVGYKVIPKLMLHDDGRDGYSVDYVNRTGWAATTCGQTQNTIVARIDDCEDVFGADATWDGETKGNAGQGTWKLVSRSGSVAAGKGREVWRDERTKLLWSSKVSTALNWCKATGHNNIPGNPAAEPDTSPSPVFICDRADELYQNITGLAISACFEDNEAHFSTNDLGIDNLGKSGLGLGSTPRVAWRLPSIYDYKQADLNGIRFVMPDQGGREWSSTVSTLQAAFVDERSDAWTFGDRGAIASSVRVTSNHVRYVGR